MLTTVSRAAFLDMNYNRDQLALQAERDHIVSIQHAVFRNMYSLARSLARGFFVRYSSRPKGCAQSLILPDLWRGGEYASERAIMPRIPLPDFFAA